MNIHTYVYSLYSILCTVFKYIYIYVLYREREREKESHNTVSWLLLGDLAQVIGHRRCLFCPPITDDQGFQRFFPGDMSTYPSGNLMYHLVMTNIAMENPL